MNSANVIQLNTVTAIFKNWTSCISTAHEYFIINHFELLILSYFHYFSYVQPANENYINLFELLILSYFYNVSCEPAHENYINLKIHRHLWIRLLHKKPSINCFELLLHCCVGNWRVYQAVRSFNIYQRPLKLDHTYVVISGTHYFISKLYPNENVINNEKTDKPQSIM